MHSYYFTLYIEKINFQLQSVAASYQQPCSILPFTFGCWFTASSANRSWATSCDDRLVGEGNGCILTWLFEKCRPSQCEPLMILSCEHARDAARLSVWAHLSLTIPLHPLFLFKCIAFFFFFFILKTSFLPSSVVKFSYFLWETFCLQTSLLMQCLDLI